MLYDLTVIKTFYKKLLLLLLSLFFYVEEASKSYCFFLPDGMLCYMLCYCLTIIISCLTMFLSCQTFCLVPEKSYFKPWLYNYASSKTSNS